MRRYIFPCLATFFLALPAAAKDLRIGDIAPDFDATTTKGEHFSLSASKGRYVVLEWTDPACPYVRKHYDTGNMQKLQQYAGNNDIVWVTIDSAKNTLKASDLNAAFASQLATPAAILLDGEGKFAADYGVRTTPQAFMIGKDGKIAYIGAIDSVPSTDPLDIDRAEQYLYEAMKQVTGGETIEFTTSKPYGCPVNTAAAK